MYATLRSAANSSRSELGFGGGRGACPQKRKEGSEDETSALRWAAHPNKGGFNMAELDNKTIAIIATDGFEDSELTSPL